MYYVYMLQHVTQLCHVLSNFIIINQNSMYMSYGIIKSYLILYKCVGFVSIIVSLASCFDRVDVRHA